MDELHDKVAILTGAAGGIGGATALAFAREGARGVVIADVNEDSARAFLQRIPQEIADVFRFVRTDVGSPQDIDELFRRTLSEFSRLDVLVNCAGICPVAPPEDISVAQWDKVMSINLRGTFLSCRAALGIMKKQRSGAIVNVSSISGRIGGIAAGVDYSASKGAIIALTMSLAKAGRALRYQCQRRGPRFHQDRDDEGFHPFRPGNGADAPHR